MHIAKRAVLPLSFLRDRENTVYLVLLLRHHEHSRVDTACQTFTTDSEQMLSVLVFTAQCGILETCVPPWLCVLFCLHAFWPLHVSSWRACHVLCLLVFLVKHMSTLPAKPVSISVLPFYHSQGMQNPLQWEYSDWCLRTWTGTLYSAQGENEMIIFWMNVPAFQVSHVLLILASGALCS